MKISNNKSILPAFKEFNIKRARDPHFSYAEFSNIIQNTFNFDKTSVSSGVFTVKELARFAKVTKVFLKNHSLSLDEANDIQSKIFSVRKDLFESIRQDEPKADFSKNNVIDELDKANQYLLEKVTFDTDFPAVSEIKALQAEVKKNRNYLKNEKLKVRRNKIIGVLAISGGTIGLAALAILLSPILALVVLGLGAMTGVMFKSEIKKLIKKINRIEQVESIEHKIQILTKKINTSKAQL